MFLSKACLWEMSMKDRSLYVTVPGSSQNTFTQVIFQANPRYSSPLYAGENLGSELSKQPAAST